MPPVRERKFVRVSAGRVVSDAVRLPKAWGSISDLHALSLNQLRSIGWYPLQNDDCGCHDRVFNEMVVDPENGFAETRYIDDLHVCKSRAMLDVAALRDGRIEAFQYRGTPIKPDHYSPLMAALLLGTDAYLDFGENDFVVSADHVRDIIIAQQEHTQQQRDWARAWWKAIRACGDHEELIDVVGVYRDSARNR